MVFSSGGCQLMNNDVLDVLCAAVTRGFPEGRSLKVIAGYEFLLGLERPTWLMAAMWNE
jgi:hypothetical protein